MKTSLPFTKGTQKSHILSFFIGLILTLVICITLTILVAVYDQADLQTFGSRIFISALSGFAIFTNPQVLATLQEQRISHAISNITVRWLVIFLVVLLSAYIEKQAQDLSRLVMILWLFVTPVILAVTAIGLRYFGAIYYSSVNRRRKAVLIWTNSACSELVDSLRNSPLAAIDMLGFFDMRSEARPPAGLVKLGNLSEAAAWLRDPVTGEMRVDVVFIGMNVREPQEIAEIIAILQDSTVSTYFVPESLIFGMPGIQIREVAGKPVLAATETPFLGVEAVPKRVFDIAVATIGILMLAPLYIIVAIGIKLTSPGPILFKQVRYGVGGKPINVFKFRSMNVSNPDAPVVQATVNDQRITRFGRFLRSTSLDEIPQFFNVLTGEMSVVGPRPHAVEHNELYRKLVTGYMLRHKIKPGITGWAQVNGYRGETNTLDKMESRVQHDLFYIRHWSIWLDIVIIMRTIRVVFKDPNAY